MDVARVTNSQACYPGTLLIPDAISIVCLLFAQLIATFETRHGFCTLATCAPLVTYSRPYFTSRTLHIPLRQECAPELLHKVSELRIDVHKRMKQSSVEITRPLSHRLSHHSKHGSFRSMDGIWVCLSPGICPQLTWTTVYSRHLVTVSFSVPFSVCLTLLPWVPQSTNRHFLSPRASTSPTSSSMARSFISSGSIAV